MSDNMVEKAYIAVSGGFDPIHSGHIDYLEDAARHGRVVVLLNSDEWLRRKKNYCFQSYTERSKILSALRFVEIVIPASDDDGTVCDTLRNSGIVFSYFGNGGDRKVENTPEVQTCVELGIEVVFGLGGDKTQSSSELVKSAKGS